MMDEVSQIQAPQMTAARRGENVDVLKSVDRRSEKIGERPKSVQRKSQSLKDRNNVDRLKTARIAATQGKLLVVDKSKLIARIDDKVTNNNNNRALKCQLNKLLFSSHMNRLKCRQLGLLNGQTMNLPRGPMKLSNNLNPLHLLGTQLKPFNNRFNKPSIDQ